MAEFDTEIAQAANIIKNLAGEPKILMFIDSEFRELIYEIENVDVIDYAEIPNIPESFIGFSQGLIVGNLQGKTVICTHGSICHLEEFTTKDLEFSMKLLSEIGIKSLIVANAENNKNQNFNVGDLVIVNDLSEAEMIEIATAIAQMLDIDIKEGLYKKQMYLSDFTLASKCGIGMLDLSYILDKNNAEDSETVYKVKKSRENLAYLIKEIVAVL